MKTKDGTAVMEINFGESIDFHTSTTAGAPNRNSHELTAKYTCQNREGHSPLTIHTAAFVHVLVLLAADFSLCFGENINLTRLDWFQRDHF
jgi:hypothetical protein